MATWQQMNPATCARCNSRLAGYQSDLPPVCNRCAAEGAKCAYPSCGKPKDRAVNSTDLCTEHAEQFEEFLNLELVASKGRSRARSAGEAAPAECDSCGGKMNSQGVCETCGYSEDESKIERGPWNSSRSATRRVIGQPQPRPRASRPRF